MPAEPLTDLFELLQRPVDSELLDEPVTDLEHALQSAALAAAAGAPPPLVAASLLHDVGHLVTRDHVPLDQDLTRDARHEVVGARFLARWFGPEVTEPVRLHVAAKRYLCATEPHYVEALSPASVRSLGVQAGAMSPEEVRAFEQEPAYLDAVALRRWDEEAKLPGLDVAPLDDYVDLLASLVRSGV